MANTEHIEAKLCAYVDGELDAQGRAEIEQHLANNPQHRQLLDELMRQRELLRGLPRERAGDDLYESFAGQLERSVLLDSELDEDEAVAGRINHWPQVYAAAAVLLLAVGLAAVIYFVLPRQPAHHVDFAIAATTTAPAVPGALDEPATQPGRESDRAVARAVNVPGEQPGNTVSLSNQDVFARSRRVTNDMGAFRAGEANTLFDSAVNRHVERATNGEVSNPMVMVVNAADPSVAQDEVTKYLGNNGYTWQQISEPAPMPLAIEPGQNIEMARAQNVHVHLKSAATEVTTNELVSGAWSATNPVTEGEISVDKVRPSQLILVRNLTPMQVRNLNECVNTLQPGAGKVQTVAMGSAEPIAVRGPYGVRFEGVKGALTATLPTTAAVKQIAATVPALGGATSGPAVLHAGDIVSLSTGKSPEMVVQSIDPDGQINVPSLGRVAVTGYTPADASERITKLFDQSGKAAGKVTVQMVRSATTQLAYRFARGDKLKVDWGYLNPDLRRTSEITVSDDGIVKLPLLGEFEAKGRTADQLARSIADSAARYDAGSATFTVMGKDPAGNLVIGRAATTQPAVVGVAAPVLGVATTAPTTQATRSATPPLAVATTIAAGTTLPVAGAEPRVDVVIVVQPEVAGATTAPATQPLLDHLSRPATVPTSAPVVQ